MWAPLPPDLVVLPLAHVDVPVGEGHLADALLLAVPVVALPKAHNQNHHKTVSDANLALLLAWPGIIDTVPGWRRTNKPRRLKPETITLPTPTKKDRTGASQGPEIHPLPTSTQEDPKEAIQALEVIRAAEQGDVPRSWP
jgi:hypothetical protein